MRSAPALRIGEGANGGLPRSEVADDAKDGALYASKGQPDFDHPRRQWHRECREAKNEVASFCSVRRGRLVLQNNHELTKFASLLLDGRGVAFIELLVKPQFLLRFCFIAHPPVGEA